jgi:two-component system, LytTR family, response regulator
MPPLNILIVDDEPHARATLRQLLAAEPGVVLAGEAGTAASAAALLETMMPDLVFLDVQLPDGTGLDLLHALPAGRRPSVVFVSGFDRFAVRAFELHAVDFLLKPFSDERFRDALARVRRRRHQTDIEALNVRVDALLQNWTALTRSLPHAAPVESPRKFVAKSGGDIHVFASEKIKWVEGQGDYLRIHSATGAALVRETMQRFLARATDGRFVRVHKSAIVNLAFVRRLVPLSSGDYRIELLDGAPVRVSRNYVGQLKDALGR